MAAYIILGMGFGILMDDKGYAPVLSVGSSILIYAGSMQYVAVSLLTDGVSLWYAALMTLMVNARHLFYGIAMIIKYKDMGLFKPYLIFGLTDETFSLLCEDKEYPKDKKNIRRYCFFVTLFDHLYWIAGTAIGALVGSLIDFDSKGIDFSMTALFVTVFVEQWLTSKEHRFALTGLGSAALCLLIFDSSIFLIPAMILISLMSTVFYLSGNNTERNT